MLKEIKLDDTFFGEGKHTLRTAHHHHPITVPIPSHCHLHPHHPWSGLTVIDTELFVLTWREHVVLVFDTDTLEEKRRMALDTEGWGIAAMSRDELAVTDGSDEIFFYNKEVCVCVCVIAIGFAE